MEKQYKKHTKDIEKDIGHKNSTYNTVLHAYGSKYFGKPFRGVYAINTIPKLKDNESCIFNLDRSDEKGSHWCAMYHLNKNYVYDSFGRRVLHKQNMNKYKNVVYTDDDKEQKESEYNCGQRCLAWLTLVYDKGIKAGLTI